MQINIVEEQNLITQTCCRGDELYVYNYREQRQSEKHFHDKKNVQLVLQPQAGDIYEMATENDHYTLLKVGRVQGDSVFVHINEYEANKKSGLSQLRGEPFSPEEIIFTKQTIRVMLKEGKILDVDR